MNKKAISPLIVNTLLILLTLTTASILFLAINNIIKETAEEISLSAFSCIDLQKNPPLKISKGCYNKTLKEIQINLYRNNDLKIQNMDFLINQGEERFSCGECCPNCEIISQGNKKYYIILNEKPESVSLVIEDCVFEKTEIDYC